MNVVVLGCGRVGQAIAKDLGAGGFDVTAVDRSRENLDRVAGHSNVKVECADLADPKRVQGVTRSADLVVGAVPGFMGFATVDAVIRAGKNIVDISFFPEDAFDLNEVAEREGVRCIVDAGVAPGLSNLIFGHFQENLLSVERFECLVGGLPVDRDSPFEYKAPFSPSDVIEEYTRPARFVAGGRVVTVPALSGVEEVELPGVPLLEAFNTDGLRTLLSTGKAPQMIEKTLRYPGHAAAMRHLRNAGFFDPELPPLETGGATSLEFTVGLLFPAWEYQEGEADLTVMRVVVEGADEEGGVKHTFDLLDFFDPPSNVSSMARTTGYTCTALVNLLVGGGPSRVGVLPPEVLGRETGALDFVLGYLKSRGISLEHRIERIPG